jgi:GT2 family glycosyltransferase
MTRDVSAVSGACLGIRTGLFRELGGFDTRFPNNYSDTDFCLRARAAGYRVISLSENSLIYRGRPAGANSVSLREREEFYSRWAKELRNPDPFYSPSLSGSGTISLAV